MKIKYQKFFILIFLLNILFVPSYALIIKPIYPSKFSVSADTPALKDILEQHKESSLTAKFLLGTTEDYNLGDFEKWFLANQGHARLLKEIIGRESHKGEDYFVFYNAASNAVKFLHMVRSIVYQKKYEEIESYLVMSPLESSPKTAKDFLGKYLEPNLYPFNLDYKNGIFDHIQDVTARLLAGALLVHDGRAGETPWFLFSENASISVAQGEEDKFLHKVLSQFFANIAFWHPKKNIDDFIKDLIFIYNQYRDSISPQLLQIFVKKKDFNSLGYYAYAGGVPVVHDSAIFLENLNKELLTSNSSDWADVIKKLLKEKFEMKELYPLANIGVSPLESKSDGRHPDWLDFLQIRLVVNNPEFYLPTDSVIFNDYYPSDENYQAVNKLKNELKKLLD